MQSKYKSLGEHIQLVDERNRNLEVINLLGISVTKNFIPSVANIVGTDMANYKIVRKNQFACSTMQVRRDKKMPVALYLEDRPSIISQAYPIFQVIDESVLLPEYLMMWFTRSEFDREACFLAVGGVRGSLEWEDFLNMELPIPSLEKQKELIEEYEAIENRIQLNKKLCATLEETAQTIYKHWFEDFEFPDENGKPYKSSGGEMMECEELGKEIPKGWRVGSFKKDLIFRTGKLDSNASTTSGDFPFFTCSEEIYKVDTFAFDQEAVLLGGNNAVGKFPLKFFEGKFNAYQRTYVINSNNKYISNKQIFFRIKGLLKQMKESSVGTTTKFLTMKIFDPLTIIIPDNSTYEIFESMTDNIFKAITLKLNQTQKLEELKSLLLGKMAVEV